ncbi:MAG: acyl transferase [Bacteroidetes bacterium]|nr:acyl transferase [Bacteroidota bacterium]
MKELENRIFNITSEQEFEACALEVFAFQYSENSVYRMFVDNLTIHRSSVNNLSRIPYLPISFFKSHRVHCGDKTPELVFTSSGTTGAMSSAHYVSDLELYKRSYLGSFTQFYAEPSEYCILALLPSYSERSGSSLIYMVDDLIRKSGHSKSGYYLKADEKLRDTLHELSAVKQKTLLLGVTHALFDFAEKFKLNLSNCIVMETGGMKGRRRELIRTELHQILTQAFGVTKIHSEFGMTELLSQAYSKGDGIFECPPWMRVEAREIDDPLSPALTQKTGGLNVIDLANLNSCSFISTQDLCKVYPDKSFEVLGRFDNSDIRGCNLLL